MASVKARDTPETVAVRPLRFLIGVALGLIPALAFGLLSAMFLRRTYETATPEMIVAEQQRHGGLYASALRDGFYEYKVALYRATTPRIVALGSSRAWGIQQAGFRESFTSLAGPVRSVEDGERLLADMKATGKLPAVALFGVDYWWFNADWNPYPEATFSDTKAAIETWFGQYFKPATWLLDRKISPRDFVSTALRGKRPAPPLPPGYGVLALYNLQGFAPDGHFRYLGTAFGRLDTGKHFERNLAEIRKGDSRFVFGEHASMERIERFRKLLHDFDAAGVHVITYLPPVASAAVAESARQGTKLAYIDEAKKILLGEGLVRYDFTDPQRLGSSDCELVDAYHGGDVIALRIVLALAEDKANGLADYVDTERVRQMIDHASGKVLVDGDAFLPRYREVDFLDLHCPK